MGLTVPHVIASANRPWVDENRMTARQGYGADGPMTGLLGPSHGARRRQGAGTHTADQSWVRVSEIARRGLRA
eukprot:scaffold8417_cov129-Isochrysis_galbana.AAC.2